MGLLLLMGHPTPNPRTLFANGEQGLVLDMDGQYGASESKRTWRRNLLSWSEQFDSTTWNKNAAGNWNAVTITANSSTAPDGTTTADIFAAPATGSHGILQQVTVLPNTAYTFSIYVKDVDYGNVLRILHGATTGSSLTEVTVTLTAQWTRISTTITTGASQTTLAVGVGKNDSNSSKTFYLWGAQLEVASTPSEYQRITDFSTEFKAAYPTHSLYQDSNGVTPAVLPGDPVGLILDTAKAGLDRLGPEMWTNPTPTIENSGGSVGVYDSATKTFTNSGSTVTNYPRFAFELGLTAGKFYQISGTLSGNTSEIASVRVATSGSANNISYNATTGSLSGFVLAAASSLQFITNLSGSESVSIQSLSIKEIPGNHAYQTTSGSRPLLARTPDGGRQNLLTYSEQFDNAAWAKTNATISAANSTTAPDGTTTADTFTGSGVSGTQRIAQNPTATGQHTYSIYAKASTHNFIQIFQNSDGEFYANFNVSTGVVGNAGTKTTASITSVGNGWYRCSVTWTIVTSSSHSLALVDSNTAGYAASSATANSVFLWGAQLETGSSATAYQKVGLTSDVTESGKRDCWGLLFDGSDDSLQTASIDFNTWTQATRRNLLTNTESFSISPWVRSNSTATDNSVATLDPLGTNTACKFIDDAVNATHHMYQPFTLTANTTYTYSIYAKAAERSWIALGTDNQTTEVVFFDIQNGVVGNQGSGYTGTITSVGNGWYRCSVVFNSTTATAANYWQVALATGNGTILFTGTGTSGVYLWGAQLEAGTLTDYQRVGTDKMTVMAGVRKLENNEKMIAELSADVNSNNGSWYFINGTTGRVAFATKGTIATQSVSGNDTSTPPITAVFTCLGSISADENKIRQNGVEVASNVNNQGSGNYGNYVLYIGSRAGTSLRFNCILYTLIVRGVATSLNDIVQFEKWTANKIGITI